MKIDGVFEGGGVKGIAFVGAVCALEEKGYKFERMAGTSAGSIVASLLAAGYRGTELKEIITEANYKKILKDKRALEIPFISLLTSNGMYSGDYLSNWLKQLFEKKGITKFKHCFSEGKCRLKIIASDITKRQILILPDDLEKYNINPFEFELWKAVRMSISIPLYFRPVELKYNGNFSFIVDGGVLSNFPVWIFDVNGVPRWPTFGFNLTEGVDNSKSEKGNLKVFLRNILDTVINRNEEVFVRDKDAVRIINIPSLGIKTTEFDITKEQSLKLFTSGYESTIRFLENWNFEEYVRKHRSKF